MKDMYSRNRRIGAEGKYAGKIFILALVDSVVKTLCWCAP